MDELKKIQKKFHEFLKSELKEEKYDTSKIEITKKLFDEEEAFFVPFGFVSYFLVCESEKPVLYVNFASRMGRDKVWFIDETGYEGYDIYDGHEDIRLKYTSRREKVKRFRIEKNIIKE